MDESFRNEPGVFDAVVRPDHDGHVIANLTRSFVLTADVDQE